MNFLNLKYFVDIANHGSVSAAARASIIAQQSMSDHLKKLEQHYGTPLFFRTKPLTLTPAGEILFRAAQEVLSKLEQAEQEMRVVTPKNAVLGLGMVFNDIPPFLGELLANMQRQKSPEFAVRVHSECLRQSHIPEEVELVLSPFALPSDWEGCILFQDRAAAVVRSDLMDRVFGSRRSAVEQALRETGDLTLLSELPFFQFTPNGPSPRVSSDPEALNLPNIVLRSGSGDLQKSVCLSGQCAITLMEKYARRAFSGQGDVLIFPLSGPQDGVEFGIYYRSGKPLSPQAAAFIRVAREYLRES